MTQQIKVVGTKSEDLSSIPRTEMTGENQLPKLNSGITRA